MSEEKRMGKIKFPKELIEWMKKNQKTTFDLEWGELICPVIKHPDCKFSIKNVIE